MAVSDEGIKSSLADGDFGRIQCGHQKGQGFCRACLAQAQQSGAALVFVFGELKGALKGIGSEGNLPTLKE
jgi:hypothetical protein